MALTKYMPRQNYFYFTIEGDDLDILLAKDIIGLPCKTYTKGEKTVTDIGREVISKSTRWSYFAKSEGKTENFLTTQLEIIVGKMPKIECYLKKYSTKMELVIYEDRPAKDCLKLSVKHLKLLNDIGVEFILAFK